MHTRTHAHTHTHTHNKLQTCFLSYWVGADVNRATTSRDHTVLSLACAGGHIGVVQYLLMKGADPSCLLKVCTSCWHVPHLTHLRYISWKWMVMSVFVCTCVYLCVPVCTCVYLCIPVYTCVYLCIPVYTYLYVRTCVYLCIRTYVYLCITVCTYVPVFTCVYLCLPVFTCVYLCSPVSTCVYLCTCRTTRPSSSRLPREDTHTSPASS